MVCGSHVACEESLISVSVYGDTLNAKWRLKINGLKQLVCLNTSWTWRTASQFLVFKTVRSAFTLFNILLMWALRWLYFVLGNFFQPDFFSFIFHWYGSACICIFFLFFSIVLSHSIHMNKCVCLLYRFMDMNFNISLQTVYRQWIRIFGGFYSGSSDMFS